MSWRYIFLASTLVRQPLIDCPSSVQSFFWDFWNIHKGKCNCSDRTYVRGYLLEHEFWVLTSGSIRGAGALPPYSIYMQGTMYGF